MLVSDNCTNFTSEEFAEFLRSNGIVHVKTAPYHSSSNGLAERAVQTVKAGITKTPEDCIHTKLLRFLLQYRITPRSTTGKSPAELLNQRSVKTKLDLLHPNLQGKVQKQQLQMKMNHDKKADGRTTAVGDTVNVKNFSHGPKWMPGVVVKVTGPVSYEVLLSDERVVRRVVNQIQRRHIDRPKEARDNFHIQFQRRPSYRMIHREPLGALWMIKSSHTRVLKRQYAARSCGCNYNQSQFSPSPTESSQPPVRLSLRNRRLPEYLKEYDSEISFSVW